MRVGIDGIILDGRDAGSLRYFEQLLSCMPETGYNTEFVVFANEKVLNSPIIPRKENILLKEVNNIFFLPGAMQQQLYRTWHLFGDLDILHSPTFVPPLRYRGRTVMTIFDLTFLRFPQTQKWTGRFWWRLLGTNGIKKANHLIAISENTKKDLYRLLNIPIEKITVIYPYAPAQFKPVINSRKTTSRYQLPESYILYVGTLERRKNITALLGAYALAKHDFSLEQNLVLVGQRGWLYRDIFQIIEDLGIDKDVIYLGYVPDEDLPGLYSGADLFVFLSLYEGFGYPVLEAMSCGVPVLTSNTSSLPEVVGDAGIMVPPLDIEQAAHKMKQILSDQDKRADLIERGLIQAKSFSQQRFGFETLAVYNKVMSACASA